MPEQNYATIVYRLEVVERMIQQLQPTKENELQLKAIHEMISTIRDDMKTVNQQVAALSVQVSKQEMDSLRRDNALQQALDKLQLGRANTLINNIVTFVIFALAAIIGAYFTYIFHP